MLACALNFTSYIRACAHAGLPFAISVPLHSYTQGGRSTTKRPVETGTQSKDDVDYQWLPEGAIPSKCAHTHQMHSFAELALSCIPVSIGISEILHFGFNFYCK